jgi:hypothetical protein
MAATLALAASVLAPAHARAAWSAPIDLVAPGSRDYLPAQLTWSPTGRLAAALTIEDVDAPGSAQAYLATLAPGGNVAAPQQITGAQQTLALAEDGQALELLTGTSRPGLDCCSSVQAGTISAAGVQGSGQTLLGGLTGATLARLVPLAGGGLVAAVAGEGGVWVSQTGAGGRFRGTRRLTGNGQAPVALATAALGGRNSLVAWSAATGPAGYADPRSIFYALGTRRSPPRRVHTLLRVPAGNRVDELSVARRGTAATAAWVAADYDARGNYHSELKAADFGRRRARVVRISSPRTTASGLAFAADSAGDQAIAFKTCTVGGGCTVHMATRARRRDFVPQQSLGAIDASQTPAVAVGSRGQTFVTWTRGGRPMVAQGAAGQRRFGAARPLSSTVYAFDATVAAGPRGQAAVAWTQGTLNPSLVVSLSR